MKALATCAALVLALTACGAGEGGGSPTPAPTDPSPVVTTAAPEPEQAPEAEPSDSPEPDAAPDLAARVEQALLEGNAVDSFQEIDSTSPGFWIASLEDVNAGTVRANIQTELDDDERETFGRWVAQMSCLNVEDLTTVVIRDVTGVDSNYFVRDSPLCSS